MACGTPVVAFKKGSMPEVIIDQQTGFLVDNVEEACQSITHLTEIDRRQCRQWVAQRFSVERMVADYLQVYQSILRTGAVASLPINN